MSKNKLFVVLSALVVLSMLVACAPAAPRRRLILMPPTPALQSKSGLTPRAKNLPEYTAVAPDKAN
jgi:hypothetical protein